MDINMHDVCRIRCGKIEKNERSHDKGNPFYTRRIRLTSDRGEAIELTLFAETEDCLYLLDGDGSRLEMQADPPDCPNCNGTGDVAADPETGAVRCPMCEGDGVATDKAGKAS